MTSTQKYPLLTAWTNDSLRTIWEQECMRIAREGHHFVDAACQCQASINLYRCLSDEEYTLDHEMFDTQELPSDEILALYDATQSYDIEPYRCLLQEWSGMLLSPEEIAKFTRLTAAA